MQEQTPPVGRTEFASSLKAAIRASGLTYAAAAEMVNAGLPPDMRVSAVSMWHYAHGKSMPRRLFVYQRVRALCSMEASGAVPHDDDGGDLAVTRHSPSSADPEDEVRLVVKDRGDGSAFVLFKGTTDWETALKAVRILCDAGVASPKSADVR
jgi:hypothetical protein